MHLLVIAATDGGIGVEHLRIAAAVLLIVLLVLGPTTIVWSSVGLGRVIARRIDAHRRFPYAPPAPIFSADQVAVLIAAHNEELVIAATIRSAATQVPLGNVFVASDGSYDRTVEVARAAGATVLEIAPNRGKAGAIVYAIEQLRIAERFELMMLLDADTHLSADYLDTALAQFDSIEVVAVAGRASTLLSPRPATAIGRFLVAHRERVYVAVQYLHKFGQAAARVNAVAIVPGFASVYRTDILSMIDIDASGLAIEDYNMTFEVHAKRLGRIAFVPTAAIAYTQDPDTVHDYVAQLHRWNLGFWQTVARHRFRLRVFWVSVAAFVLEVVVSSVVLLLIVPLLVVSLVAPALSAAVDGPLAVLAAGVASSLPPWAVLLGLLVPDLLLTLLYVVVDRRPGVLVYALAFPLMRIVDAWICLRALGHAVGGAVGGRSDGRWRSPSRRGGVEADARGDGALAASPLAGSPLAGSPLATSPLAGSPAAASSQEAHEVRTRARAHLAVDARQTELDRS